jgi:26S proteasome regulatory subunit N1
MVGTAVDIVGQTGNPRTITGFQTHNAPVLLSSGDRCELSTEEFTALTDLLEDIVIIKENPEYKRDSKK